MQRYKEIAQYLQFYATIFHNNEIFINFFVGLKYFAIFAHHITKLKTLI